MNTPTIKLKVISEGEDGIPVRFTKRNERSGANPADRLAADEYKTDSKVHRRLRGNISDNITGTVA